MLTYIGKESNPMINDQDYVAELLTNESFLNWHFKTDPSDIMEWDNRLMARPELKADVDKAVQILNALQLKEPILNEGQLEAAEKRLLTNINQPSTNIKARVINLFKGNAWKWVAASTIFIACITILVRTTSKPFIDTTFAQIKEQQLPDGSKVVLNANSKLTYSREWDVNGNKDREVWIKGEAFFHVKKTAAKTRFIVHTAQFDIVVTGTQFNVYDRDEKHPKVVLREGSITIKRGCCADVFLKPGESFELADNNIALKKTTNPEIPMAWIDRKLNFDNAPMSDLKKALEDIYGIGVVFADADIATENITAMMPNDNLDVFIRSLQATMAYKVVKKDNVLTISKIR